MELWVLPRWGSLELMTRILLLMQDCERRVFVGQQGRSAEDERVYNRRWLITVIGGPLLAGVLVVVWMFMVAQRLPTELATHWNGKNDVDGHSSLWSMAAVTVALAAGTGCGISFLAIATRSQNLLIARIGVGFGVGFGTGMVALMAAIVAGQLDLVDPSAAVLSAPVMAGGLGLAFVAGAAAIWLYRPGETERAPDRHALAMNEAVAAMTGPLAVAGQDSAVQGETMAVKVSMARWGPIISLGIGAATGVGLFFIFPLLALLGAVLGGVIWIFTRGTAMIGPDGVKVLAAGFYKVMPLQWDEIKRATVEDIKALDYGGWGYRINGGSVGFIMASGPALVIEAGFHQKFVISMPDVKTAGKAAALVNGYVHATTVKS